MAKRSDSIRLDLNSPDFQEVLFALETTELKQVMAALGRLRSLDWNTLYRHAGFHWEVVEHVPTPTGAQAHSVRLSQRVRAIAYRDGVFLRLVSLHPDHDSAYRR